jgi:hypothetical protein
VKKKNFDIRLDQLVKHNSPYAVFEEVKNNFIHHYHISEFIILKEIFDDYVNLMEGRNPKYKKCSVKFHDIQHTAEVILALSRLIDGYNIKNPHNKFSVNKVKLVLIAAIFHDIGYLQKADEPDSSGAKYTKIHVDRSVEIAEDYFNEKKVLNKKDLELVKKFILSTEVNIDLSRIKYKDKKDQILAYMITTADFLGQMSSRTYLEKLLFLYKEFKEGGITAYSSELDLIQKTPQFYNFVLNKLKKDFSSVYEYAEIHFQTRYKINKNLYIVAIERQINYLRENIKTEEDLYKKLHRMNETGTTIF